MKTGKCLIAVLLLTCVASGGAGAAETELNEFIEIFSYGTSAQQRTAAKELQYSGLSDPALFDLIEQRLLEKYPDAEEKIEIETVSWFAKGLATSGNEKYRPTLEQVVSKAESSKIRRHAKNALRMLDEFAVWNPVIADTSNYDPEQSTEFNQYANMLRSDAFELKRVGAKRIYSEKIKGDYLLSILVDQINVNYQEENEDRLFVDTVSWMCKALAATQLPEYQSIIAEVASNGGTKKVRANAEKYQRYFDG